ncbi:SsrA-binding protein SmpB [Candidatus Omnitrophota bacterium]
MNIAKNKKAFFDYHLFDRFEAGIELKGAEVKSIRQGKVNLKDGFARIENNEIFLCNVHINPYKQSGPFAPESKRTRKLLLHKHEIAKLTSAATQKGQTIVPTSLYFKNGRVKVEIAIAKGKKFFDKREKLRSQTVDRETKRSLDSRKK